MFMIQENRKEKPMDWFDCSALIVGIMLAVLTIVTLKLR